MRTNDCTADTWSVWIAIPNEAGDGWEPWYPLTGGWTEAAEAHAYARDGRTTYHGHLYAVRRGNAGHPRPLA